VVAHPDDEVMATAYLAREIYDNHKKVAVVYETTGDGGNNDVVQSKPRPWARFARSRHCAP
jgi:LmbE family N-acetylglucosaminyl deacetylase